LLNRNGLLFADLVEDGVMGPKTLHGLDIFLQHDESQALLLWINVFQGMRYVKIIQKNPSQEKFARGWGKRLKLT
jgi:hypothetical protein